jgi:predicted RNA methylase
VLSLQCPQSGADVDAPVIERASDNDTFDAGCGRGHLAQGVEIIEAAHAAGSDHRYAEIFRQRRRLLMPSRAMSV